MTDEKKPIGGGDLRELIAANTPLQHGFWMNASAAGKLFDLCHGSKELPDDEGNMLPCVGCRGCKVPDPPVSGVKLK
jgi:hypothetical protein